ncbi:MAG: hypothetical protein JW384_04386 [Nitrosomonadaceae bacterium]|nr:hypothetical protein [Nitrosomonadaceae bacterium]
MRPIETFIDCDMVETGRMMICTYLCEPAGLLRPRLPPVYESMAYVADEGDKAQWGHNIDYKRHEDEQAAIEGHKAMVAKWQTPPRNSNAGWEKRLALFQYLMARPYGR